MIGSTSYNMAEEYKCLCNDEIRTNDVKSCSKYKKRWKHRVKKNCHLLHKDEVEIAGIKKKSIGFRKRKSKWYVFHV